jgi:hypothetical protein
MVCLVTPLSCGSRLALIENMTKTWAAKRVLMAGNFVSSRLGLAIHLILAASLSHVVCWAANPLAPSLASHPRLLVRQADLQTIRKAIVSDSFTKWTYDRAMVTGEALLNQPPDTYDIEGPEHTLLATSRDMEERIITLSGLYLLTGRKEFAARATQEMLAAAAFPDWYPAHFLDTAELSAALGIGYDWLFPVLSQREKHLIRRALIDKGMKPWIARIQSGNAKYTNNWVQVCHGGEALAALALASEEPGLSRQVLDYARPAMQQIMQRFAPDGGFEEGPGYWNYATIYNVLYLSALDTSLGTDYGLSGEPGFSETGNYRIQSIGPTYLYANFGDAHAEVFPSPQMFWFARRFNNAAYAEQERRIDQAVVGHMDSLSNRESSRFQILGVFWAATAPQRIEDSPARLAAFSRVNQVYMRSSWEANAWYVGFKGGNARASHGHLDLGSFVLDAGGQRWALDLGPDSYGLPDYFGSHRWDYYRLRTEGHNTLTVDGKNQETDANAPIATTHSGDHSRYAIVDLDTAYSRKLLSWKRGIRLDDAHGLLVQDEVTPKLPVDLCWSFHTGASITISPDGQTALLRQNGQSLRANIQSPSAGRFEIADTGRSPPEASNKGITSLTIKLPKQLSPITIAVEFSSVDDHAIRQPTEPLPRWGLY